MSGTECDLTNCERNRPKESCRQSMLPNHCPLVIAEQFGTLESLYPGRIDLGLAVTLEFLGPLSVALAPSRRLVDLVCAVAAAARSRRRPANDARALPLPSLKSYALSRLRRGDT